jgi:hypothetical protein
MYLQMDKVRREPHPPNSTHLLPKFYTHPSPYHTLRLRAPLASEAPKWGGSRFYPTSAARRNRLCVLV